MKLNMKKAFTLVEMLIVIVIIGILAAALIPRLTGIQGRARDVARKGDLQQISTALATYNLDNGSYIVSATESITIDTTLGALKTQNLIKSIPVETNKTAVPYAYQTFNSGAVFALKALSEGGGVNANWGSSATFTAGYTGTVTTSADITRELCTKVDQNLTASKVAGGTCADDVNGLKARYVLAN